MKHHCAECNKEFGSSEALQMHNSAKHAKPVKAVTLKLDKKLVKNLKLVGVAGVALIIFLFVANFFTANAYDCRTEPAELMNIGSHSGLYMHIHPWLEIVINGQNQLIPAGTGLAGSNWMSPVHTHDSTGELHIEAPCIRDFQLGDFFKIWKQTFNATCIFNNCVDANHTLELSVNGFPSYEYENVTLHDGDRIRIVYGEKT